MDEKEIKEAEDRGRRKQIVDGRLDGHDRRLASINGSIDRNAHATEKVAERLDKLTHRIEAMDVQLKTKAEVDQALRRAAEQTAKETITRREYWMGIIIVAGAILSAALQAGHVL